MAKLVILGAQLRCSQGTAPSVLTVLPAVGTSSTEQPVATINDFVPMKNVATFGLCRSPANPQVAAATAAAQGTLTPMPCIPALTAPWAPGSTAVTLMGVPALRNDSKCTCSYGGLIEITEPGATVQAQ